MTPRYQKSGRIAPTPEPLRVTNPHAAGIDVHAAEHWVAVPPDHVPPPRAEHPSHLLPYVRKFGACTADLEGLADWLQTCGRARPGAPCYGVSRPQGRRRPWSSAPLRPSSSPWRRGRRPERRTLPPRSGPRSRPEVRWSGAYSSAPDRTNPRGFAHECSRLSLAWEAIRAVRD